MHNSKSEASIVGRYAGRLIILLAATGFSAKAILVKLAYAAAPVDPLTLLALRMLFSLPFFLFMGMRAGETTRMQPRDYAQVFLLGILGYYLASLFDFLGLQHISAGLERLILFLYPTLVLLIGAAFYRRKIHARDYVSLALSYLGIGLVFANAPGSTAHLIGVIEVFIGTLAYALYIAGSSNVIQRIGATRFTAWAMSVSCLAVILQFLVTHPLSALAVPAPVFKLSALMAILSTVLPTWLLALGIKRIGANEAALISAIGPVLTIYMGVVILGEHVGPIQLVGTALVLAGIVIITLKKPARPATTAQSASSIPVKQTD